MFSRPLRADRARGGALGPPAVRAGLQACILPRALCSACVQTARMCAAPRHPPRAMSEEKKDEGSSSPAAAPSPFTFGGAAGKWAGHLRCLRGEGPAVLEGGGGGKVAANKRLPGFSRPPGNQKGEEECNLRCQVPHQTTTNWPKLPPPPTRVAGSSAVARSTTHAAL